MVTNAEAADRRPRHVEEAVSDGAALEVRAVLLQAT